MSSLEAGRAATTGTVATSSALHCPGCSTELTRDTVDGHYGRRVDIDLCRSCGAFWFDRQESLTLGPGAVLRLFVLIDEATKAQGAARHALPDQLVCPRCRAALVRTFDVQRATRFSYWRCPGEHGRLITFGEFLREKNFVRPLSGPELDELRQNVKQIVCSSCGAPIDLQRVSVCGYCRAPVSVLDARQVEKVVAALKAAEERSHTVDPVLPARLAAERLEAERTWRRLELATGWDAGWRSAGSSSGLVEVGVAALVRLLTSRE
jgi:Zn-finger nucleic acid-binding protein